MKRRILFLLLPAMLLTGCNKDELGSDPDTPGGTGDAIRFEIGFAPQDAAAGIPQNKTVTAPDFKTTWEVGDAIGIYIVKGSGGLQASGNYVDNVKLTRQGDGTWEIDGGSQIYYPSDVNSLNFYAYYPYDEYMTNPTAYTFSVQADQSGNGYSKSDLMTAKTENVSESRNAVQLQFKHALSLVQVEVKREVNVPHFDGDFTVTLTEAKPATQLGWSSDLTGAGTPTNIVMHKVAGMTNTYRALVPAQTLGVDSKVSFVQTISGQEIDMTYPGIASAALPAKGTRKYSVTLGWGIDPNHAYAVGDAYPHTGPAVGIVYWLDPASGGKHGKAVWLKEKSNVKWADSYSTINITDIANGRANMRTIQGLSANFSGYPVFAWVHSLNDANEDYGNANATGVWYLPARDELSALYSAYDTYGKSNFNGRLTAAGGDGLGSYWYWSSSEDDAYLAWYVNFDFGFTHFGLKLNDINMARCVLAF
ncbi:fimbrillin family protein [Proteiniphilum sp. UBA5384]|uniref:fimbrillin family protein n=1 Tax=Proteiniphilum sp. UBA5384 TaxID=1947279 RepID=UPI0025E754DE|nr:fimbrillin family protein [Proteiniphilum sp. UBA5384]